METEHPDVAAARVTGYPAGKPAENRDTAEARREFAKEHAEEFLLFALAGDDEILERFTEHYRWRYQSWLN